MEKLKKVKERMSEADASELLLQIVGELLSELHRGQTPTQNVTLDSALDRDLGLDSLGRLELIARIEKRFHLALPEQLFIEANSPRDLLRAMAISSEWVEQDTSVVELRREVAGEAAAEPTHAQTLVEVLNWHLKRHPDKPHIQLYHENEEIPPITYQQLASKARIIAAGLQQRGIRAEEPVAIMLPTGEAFFYSFFGILLAGGIPVPVYPPARPDQLEEHILRLKGIIDNCQAAILITIVEAKQVARLLKSQVHSVSHIVTIDELMRAQDSAALPVVAADNIAFLQYTSGSTGSPKGVVLTHANLLANIRAMGRRVRASDRDVFVSWLPLYHDMGLIGAWLGSLYYDAMCVILSPQSFITRPQRWLWAIHKYRGTLSASPNFGYELCLRRVHDEDIEGLDLSSWRMAFNGAEAISPEATEQFVERFSHYGFRVEAMSPVYGLAESSVGLTFPNPGEGLRIDNIQRKPFMTEGLAIPAEASDENVLRFVSCGLPLDYHQVRIVDAFDHELPERQQGRLQFCGPSTTSGYYRNPEKTRELYHGKWLDSGDIAYIASGNVYITGRVKDMIIRAGQNLYPQEVEDAVGNINGIRKGRVAVFAARDPHFGTEKLVVLAETRETGTKELSRLRTEVNAITANLVGSPADEVVLMPPNTVLKTSSGKIRRAASRALYESGKMGRRKKSVWLQVTDLLVNGLIIQLSRIKPLLKNVLFSFYAKSVFWVLAPLTWFLIAVLPKFSWRWAVMRGMTNTLFFLTRIPVSVEGRENILPAETPCVYVVNHASYLDGPLLVTVIGRAFSFVAKNEFVHQFIAGTFLRRIGAEFVERFDVEKGVADAQHLSSAVTAGKQLLFFPEGTFTRMPGLLPFHMGAFVAAAASGVPVVPVVIRGMRSILRSDSRTPFRGKVSVTVCAPIHPGQLKISPDESAWSTALALRNAAREQMLRLTGEPDMASTRVL